MNIGFESIVGILLGVAVGLWLFYLIVRAAVKDGTRPMVDELKKQAKQKVS